MAKSGQLKQNGEVSEDEFWRAIARRVRCCPDDDEETIELLKRAGLRYLHGQ